MEYISTFLGTDYDINEHGKMWQVIKVDKNNGYRDLEDKVKFKCGEVILSTLNYGEAMDLLMKYIPDRLKDRVGCQVIISSYNSVVTCGNYSNIRCGRESKITSGCNSTTTSGFKSTIISGNDSTINSGDNSNITSGDGSNITSGYNSTIISGNDPTIISGSGSTITSGDGSTVIIKGDYVTFTLGKDSRVMTRSSIFIEGIDFKANEEVVIKDGKIIKGGYTTNRIWRKFCYFLKVIFKINN
ncbi:MAG: hypothetical protein E6R13_07835 [Spirochaetes bacterium]|nr:MAG: hypothetical protein E6R13_07835 [Spirochaetota bacterium]